MVKFFRIFIYVSFNLHAIIIFRINLSEHLYSVMSEKITCTALATTYTHKQLRYVK